MNALIVAAVFCQTVMDEPAFPAIAEAPVIQVETFRVERYTLNLYRQFQSFEFFLGTRSYRQRWTKFWIEAKDDRTREGWVPWVIYEPTDFRGPASKYFPRGFSLALRDQAQGDAASRKAIIVYLYGEGMCKYFVFDLLNSSEHPERAFSTFLKPQPKLDGQLGNGMPTPEGTTWRNRIFMYELVKDSRGDQAMKQFVDACKTIEKLNWTEDGWRLTVVTDSGKLYSFVRPLGSVNWEFANDVKK